MDEDNVLSAYLAGVKNFGHNIKSRVAPERVKQGTMQDRKVRVYRHRDYDRKVTTYKIVTYIPKKDI